MLKVDSPEEGITTWVIYSHTQMFQLSLSQNQQKSQSQTLILISQSEFITSETCPISLKATRLPYERSS